MCENEDELIMGFLDGTHTSRLIQEEVKIPVAEVECIL